MALDPVRNPAHSGAAGHAASGSHASSLSYTLERQVLAKLLEHLEFNRSYSSARFLAYICGKYFEGRQDEIREYSIAVDALGRKEGSFDSRIDPIVRVTARALRKKLVEYYENEGKDAPLRIVLPLGHYIPRFVDNVGPVAAAEPVEEADESVEEPVTIPSSKRSPLIWLKLLASARYSKPITGLLILLVAFAGGYLLGHRHEASGLVAGKTIEWGEPIWSDEFDGPAMQAPASTNWGYDVGGGGWGALQKQFYCPASGGPKECNPHQPNAFLDGAGHLVIRAERNPDGLWTSARLSTRNLHEFQNCRIEARMKLPVGKGLWPAFWMLGSNFSTAGWPEAGSLGVVENVSLDSNSNGLGPNIIRSTVHGPRYSGANGLWHDFHLPNGGRVDDAAFHTYGAILSPGMIQFYVDNPENVYFTTTPEDLPEGGKWVFDHPFYLIMNLGIGGEWPGDPNQSTPNPADILVDYVRVYKIPDLAAPSIQLPSIEVHAGSTVVTNVLMTAQNYIGRVHLGCSTEPATISCSLASPVVNFSDTLSQQDTLTLSTGSLGSNGPVAVAPGNYKLTIVATSMSGNHTQLVVPIQVKEAAH